jgi:hypothetical protein
MMILVGAVFVAGPAGLLAMLTPESLKHHVLDCDYFSVLYSGYIVSRRQDYWKNLSRIRHLPADHGFWHNDNDVCQTTGGSGVLARAA